MHQPSDPISELKQSNKSRRINSLNNKRADEQFGVSLQLVRRREAAWYILRDKIKNPAEPEQVTDDRIALAEAFEELGERIRESGWQEYVQRAREQAKENLHQSEIDARKEGWAGKNTRAEYDILTVLEAAVETPGIAIELTSLLTMSGFPSNHVSKCELLVSAQLPSRNTQNTESPKDNGGPPMGDNPAWHADIRELRFRRQVVRKVAPQGPNVAAVFAAFEDAGWPRQLRDPLHNKPDSERVKVTVSSINSGMNGPLRFSQDATVEGFRWDIIDDREQNSS